MQVTWVTLNRVNGGRSAQACYTTLAGSLNVNTATRNLIDKPVERDLIDRPAECDLIDKPVERDLIDKPVECNLIDRPAECK